MILVIGLLTLLHSHSGRTNAEGCHNQRGGSYHCHGSKKTKQKRQSSKSSTNSGDYNCEREYCKYMISCEKAYYKFKQCGHYRLDGDGDGVPCENICPGG